MRRREFITLLGGATFLTFTARAQQPDQVRRIGVLMNLAANDPQGQARVAGFLQGLKQAGWTDDANARIDIRWAAGNADEIRRHATELAALAPDVILAHGSATVGPLLQATRTVPIVFVYVPDPVGAGYVDSLSRPGGNATGFIAFEYGISVKWLELLKQIAPAVTRVAVIRDPAITAGIGQFGALQAVAPSVGVVISPVNVRDAGEIERALAAFAQDLEHGPDRDRERAGRGSSRYDCLACGPAQTARGLLRTLLRLQRRPDFLRARYSRPISPGGPLRRSHP